MSGISALGVGAASNALYITSNANIGIGKSNAAYALDVVGDVNFSGSLRSNGVLLSMEIPAAITVDNVDAKTSAILSIGANAATTTLNLGTNGGTQAINMGTGSGVKTITIGGGTDDAITINGNLTVSGTTISVNSSNAVIMDKIITLNKGGAAASGGLVGLEVEEAGTSNVGYLRTNAARDAWVAKAPNGSEVTLGYTVSAPLSLSGTALSVANATTSAPGVVQVGSGLSVSGGVLSVPQNYISFGINTNGSTGYRAGSSSTSVVYMKQGPISIDSAGIITCGAIGLYAISFSSVGAVQGNVYVRYNGASLASGLQYGSCYLYGWVNAGLTVYIKTTSASDTIDFYQNTGTFQANYASFNVIQVQ
jgi:hypothetical protein